MVSVYHGKTLPCFTGSCYTTLHTQYSVSSITALTPSTSLSCFSPSKVLNYSNLSSGTKCRKCIWIPYGTVQLQKSWCSTVEIVSRGNQLQNNVLIYSWNLVYHWNCLSAINNPILIVLGITELSFTIPSDSKSAISNRNHEIYSSLVKKKILVLLHW